ncbi:alpha/beta fold hydrolase [Agromyces sp. Leaf222]|uniref:alpha/beta fold hydrolase n=1 Tax=Agromyces sp. Leaf222 TaxID=1735688 RepID=UPI0006FB966E|nr:alpha/beta hydrolase [Agromyces sp. Leaf222]KQM82578.1 alpha/beta hydrolase [Agromyces sp. Leaf222]
MNAIPRLQPLRHVETSRLDVAYFEAGPQDGPPVVLLHGFPYDIHSYVDVAPMLADSGFRVIVPFLRGHGETRFLRLSEPRTGQQAALGQDVIELLDALGIPKAILAGYDWGGRAACVVAALEPERVTALVAVNGYLVQDIRASMRPLPPELEAGFWYFFYFLTERGRLGLAQDPRGIAEVIWRRNSPDWRYDEAELDRAAAAFDNPDFFEVVIHSYRHRLAHVDGAPEYARLEARLAQLPSIEVPAVTLDGLADGNFPARDATAAGARFAGPHEHRRVPHAGHNLPQEAPRAFADAVRRAAELAGGQTAHWPDVTAAASARS